MSITISIYTMVVIAILALMVGFWIGRSVKWMMLETESRISEDSDEQGRIEDVPEGIRIPLGWSIGSPVAGTVRSFNDGVGVGALIRPEQGAVYAPASGKITRLYPMGNAMRLRTDSGVELIMRVGETSDELHSVYYRARVIQNEIVNKGKMLLEFDLEGLQKEGVDTAVSLVVEPADPSQNVIVTRKEQVKAGEELLWIRESIASD